MGYADEAFIKRLTADKCQTKGTIREGIILHEEKIEFKENILFNGKFTIMLPSNFDDMLAEDAKFKYPMEQRPPVIKTSENVDIDFTFNLLPQSIPDGYLEKTVDTVKKALRRYQPANVFCDKGILELDTVQVVWFDFLSNGVDGRIYNFMYYLSMGDKTMNGVFNCPIKKTEDWKPIVLEILKTIRVEK